MVKAERMQVDDVPGTAWLTGMAAWFIPGLGHALLKRWVRAILMGGAVWVCFFVGLAMGGHLFDLTSEGSIALLQIPPMIANLGTGALYLVSAKASCTAKERTESARTAEALLTEALRCISFLERRYGPRLTYAKRIGEAI